MRDRHEISDSHFIPKKRNKVTVTNFVSVPSFFVLYLSFMLGFQGIAYALPEGGQITAGSGSIEQINPNTLTINATDNTIIDYSSFNIGTNETVIVNLPNSNSQLLNRVLGNSLSELLGTLNSNGLFILVNPNGIHVGPQAQLNAASLIFSTRDITNQDFLSANYLFQKISDEQMGRLLFNEGLINIEEGGFGVLIAGGIDNRGTIVAPLGKIALAAGDAVRLDIAGGGLIGVAIEQETAAAILDFNGNPILDQLSHSGTLQSEGGSILLHAAALPNIFSNVINVDGLINARSVLEGANGEIVFLATDLSQIGATVQGRDIRFNSFDGNATFNLKSGAMIQSDGDFVIGSGVTVNAGDAKINVSGDWVNQGTFEGQNSTVEFTGADQASILGETRFNNFTVLAPTKVLNFEAGKTQTILGLWKIRGAYQQHVRLLSTLDAKQWLVDPRGPRDISYAWVKDSYNLDPVEIVMTESTSRGNSFNWDPPATWNGPAGGSWSTGAHWLNTGGVEPGAGDDVLFNGTANTNSTVDAAFGGSIGSLTINAGYSSTITLARSLTITDSSGRTGDMDLNSGTISQGANTFTVVNDATVAGGTFTAGSGSFSANTLAISSGTFTGSSGGVTVTGAVNQTGGTFTGSSGNATFGSFSISLGTFTSPSATLDINGAFSVTGGSFTAPASGVSFLIAGNFTHSGGTFTHNSGTVTFDGTSQTIDGSTTFNNFTKRDTTDNGTDETLTFTAGTTQTISGALTLRGTDASDRVNLVSSSPGSTWGLTANGSVNVDFVDVTDSNASGGNKITATNSVNGGNNANWDFGTTVTNPEADVDQTISSLPEQGEGAPPEQTSQEKNVEMDKKGVVAVEGEEEGEDSEETQAVPATERAFSQVWQVENPYEIFATEKSVDFETRVNVYAGSIFVRSFAPEGITIEGAVVNPGMQSTLHWNEAPVVEGL